MQLYIAQSIDGYIAQQNGDIDFLEQQYLKNTSFKEMLDLNYETFLQQIDVVIVGFKTYNQIKQMGIKDQYPNKTTYVITNRHFDMIDDTIDGFITFDQVKELDLSGKRVYIVGGSQIIKLAMDAKMINELNLFIIPVVLNQGIKLFDDICQNHELKLISVDNDQSIVNINYKIQHKSEV